MKRKPIFTEIRRSLVENQVQWKQLLIFSKLLPPMMADMTLFMRVRRREALKVQSLLTETFSLT